MLAFNMKYFLNHALNLYSTQSEGYLFIFNIASHALIFYFHFTNKKTKQHRSYNEMQPNTSSSYDTAPVPNTEIFQSSECVELRIQPAGRNFVISIYVLWTQVFFGKWISELCKSSQSSVVLWKAKL